MKIFKGVQLIRSEMMCVWGTTATLTAYTEFTAYTACIEVLGGQLKTVCGNLIMKSYWRWMGGTDLLDHTS